MRLLLRQLELAFERSTSRPRVGCDFDLEFKARELLRQLGAEKLSREIRVEWNPRMKSAAGRADFRGKLISLNPCLVDHGVDEIDRTLRHELAHLLAQFRVGRRRIAPHGPEWRQACCDLGIADEARCHNLPFVAKVYPRPFVYRCPRLLHNCSCWTRLSRCRQSPRFLARPPEQL